MKKAIRPAKAGLKELADQVREDQKHNALWPVFITWYKSADPLKPDNLTEAEAIVFLWAAFLRGAVIGVQQAIRHVHRSLILNPKDK